MSSAGLHDRNRLVVGEQEEEEVLKIPFFKLFAFAEKWDYLLMVVGSLGAFIHGAAFPFILVSFGKLINTMAVVSPSSSAFKHKVFEFSMGFVYLGAVTLFSSCVEIACWMHTGERQATKMRMAYLQSMLDQDISVFDIEVSTGEVINAITSGVLVVQDTIAEKVGNTIYCISRFIIGFGVSFACVWQISLVTLSIVPFIVIAGGIFAYVATLLIGRVRKYHLKAGEIAHETIENIRTVQAFACEDNALKRYKNALQMAYQYGKRGGLAKGLGLGMVYCILFLSWTLLIWFTSILVHKNVSNGGELFTTMLNVISSGLSLGMAAPNISMFLRARTAAYPIFKMIERSRTTRNRSGIGNMLSNIDGHIEFCNVRFSYPSRPDALIFDDLNLNIPAGKIVAVVGGSGSGKSTIISLIERFYEPLSGVIRLDGHDIKGLDLSWLRRQIGLVNQEPVLFATSIRENILYGKEDASFQEIIDAAKLSEAITFINDLPDQFETQVGERGIQLSGGQKQRIAIARAIVKNPSILLLDEATSALDAESEKCVQEALDRVMVGRTTVMVAHRLSTIRNADIIAVVQGGKIVEVGTHDRLMLDPHSAYASLVHLHDNPFQQSCHYDTGNFCEPQSVKCSLDLSDRTSLGSSFRSEKDSVNPNFPEAIDASKAKPVSMKRLYAMIYPDWLFGVLGTLGALAVGAQFPLFALGVTQALVSFYFDWETMQREIKKIAVAFLAGSMLIVIFQAIEHLNFGIMGERLTLRIREKMFQAILHNEIGWFDKMSHNSALLSSRLETDATLIKSIVVDHSTVLLQNLGTIMTSFIIAFILNWRITLVVLATYPLVVTAHIIEKLFMKGFGGNLHKGYSKANIFAAEAATNIRTIAAFCLENTIINLYAKELESHSKKSFRRFYVAGAIFGVFQFLMFSSYGLVQWYGSTLMSKGLVSFKSIIKSLFVLMVSGFGVADSLATAPNIFKGTQMAASVFEILDRKTQVVCNAGDDVERVEGMIDMKAVEFRYPSRPDVVILKEFNLRVNAGKSMALIGTSGCGKSTVIALILRFYDPAAGKVTIDGKDIKNLRLMSLRKHIGLVQQEPALFSTTIYENILYGKDDATESDIIEAATLANAHTFISALPEGYSTLVGKGGIQLSGGQKQRVAIARAVIKNPAILLLDEATSALDVESERAVQQALDTVMKGRTTVTVAHRLSTIRNADIISVLQNGKVIEQGNHSTLVQNKTGAYFQLISLQQ